jgi:hypothetical protein
MDSSNHFARDPGGYEESMNRDPGKLSQILQLPYPIAHSERLTGKTPSTLLRGPGLDPVH